MAKASLPLLREDIQLIAAAPDNDGFPTWKIYDKVRHAFFEIGWLEFEILSRWHLQDASKIVAQINQETTLRINEKNFEVVLDFLTRNDLLQTNTKQQLSELSERYQAAKKKLFKSFIHSYLFIRIPLVKPDRFLEKTLFLVKPLLTKWFFYLLIFLAITGFYLVSRQWDQFISTYDYFFNINNLVYFVLAIVITKIIHEFAHAYVSKYYGCKVSTIGLAFLVMWPVLYTDTTDAWRLTRVKERLAINAAGMAAELSLAIIATFLWSFLPDGVGKSLAFYIATISWFLTIAININPMLRFDGYYLFSDLIGVENMQAKGFVLGKWQLREWLFKFNEPPPQVYPKTKKRLLLLYAYATWIYRFFLFLAIAILVYYFFFKVLGIILMVIEVVYFILMPIGGELKNYWKRRHKIKNMNKNTIITFTVLIVLIAIFFIPWQTRIDAPAALEFAEQAKIYTDFPAQLNSLKVSRGDKVTKDEVIATLNSPDLEQKIKLVESDIKILQLRLYQERGLGQRLGYKQADLRELESKRIEYLNLLEEKQKLVVRAPIDGIVVAIASNLHVGQWLNKDTFIMELAQTQERDIKAYVPENDLERVLKAKKATFYPSDPDVKPIKAKVISIGRASTNTLVNPYLASIYGGAIAVYPKQENRIEVKDAVYEVVLQPQNNLKFKHSLRGEAVIYGKPESFAAQLWRAIASVWVKESGF